MKRYALSLILLLVLGIGAYLLMQRPGESSSTGAGPKGLATIDSMAVDRLDLATPGMMISIEKQAGIWMMVNPIRYRANEEAVGAAIGRVKSIDLGSVVSDNPAKQQLFQVDSTGIRVKVFERGTKKVSFVVGKASSSYAETYVRREESNDVYLAKELLTQVFPMEVDNWRDKSILRIDEETIESVSFRFGDTLFTLQKQDSIWTIGEETAEKSVVTGVLSSLAQFHADGFIDSPVTDTPKLVAVVTLQGKDVRFHNNGSAFVVSTSESPQLFEVQQWRVDQILKRKADFLKK